MSRTIAIIITVILLCYCSGCKKHTTYHPSRNELISVLKSCFPGLKYKHLNNGYPQANFLFDDLPTDSPIVDAIIHGNKQITINHVVYTKIASTTVNTLCYHSDPSTHIGIGISWSKNKNTGKIERVFLFAYDTIGLDKSGAPVVIEQNNNRPNEQEENESIKG